MATAPIPVKLAIPVAPDVAGDFADAFKELTADDNEPKLAEPGTDPVVEGAAAAQAEAEAKAPVQIEIEGLPDPSKVGADGKVADPAAPAAGATGAAQAAAQEPAKLSNEELLDRFRTAITEAPKPAPVQVQAAAPPAPALESKPAISAYTPEQQKVVEDYMRDFPDVYNAEQLIRAREYQALVAHIFAELTPTLQSLQQTTGQLSVQTHIEKLQAAVPDYNEVAPKVMEWIDKQPAYLKAAYSAVAQTGGVGDVVDLIGRYRAETGTAAPAVAPATLAAAAAQTAAAPAVARVARALAPVAGKRTGVQTEAIQMDDFDGAFGAFSKAS